MTTHTYVTISGNASTGGTGGGSANITGTVVTDYLQEPNDDGGTTAIGFVEVQSGYGETSAAADTDSDLAFYISGSPATSCRIDARSQGSASGTGPGAGSSDTSLAYGPNSGGSQTLSIGTSYVAVYSLSATSTITGMRVKGTTFAPTNAGTGFNGGGAVSPTAPLRTIGGLGMSPTLVALPSTAGAAFDSGWVTSDLNTGLVIAINQGQGSTSTVCEEMIDFDWNAEIEFWVRASGKTDTLIKTFRARYDTQQQVTDACG